MSDLYEILENIEKKVTGINMLRVESYPSVTDRSLVERSTTLQTPTNGEPYNASTNAAW